MFHGCSSKRSCSGICLADEEVLRFAEGCVAALQFGPWYSNLQQASGAKSGAKGRCCVVRLAEKLEQRGCISTEFISYCWIFTKDSTEN
jgi:hypothetical protein